MAPSPDTLLETPESTLACRDGLTARRMQFQTSGGLMLLGQPCHARDRDQRHGGVQRHHGASPRPSSRRLHMQTAPIASSSPSQQAFTQVFGRNNPNRRVHRIVAHRPIRVAAKRILLLGAALLHNRMPDTPSRRSMLNAVGSTPSDFPRLRGAGKRPMGGIMLGLLMAMTCPALFGSHCPARHRIPLTNGGSW